MSHKDLSWLVELEELAASKVEYSSLSDFRKDGWVTMEDLYRLMNAGPKRCGSSRLRATMRELIANGQWESVETVAYGDDGKINRRVIYRKSDGSNPTE